MRNERKTQAISSPFPIPHSPFNKRGQSVLEYTVLIAVVCVVAVGSQVYAKRAVQGRLKQGVDMIGQRASNLAQGRQGRHPEQLEPEPGQVGTQFSPALSNFTVSGTIHQRSRTSLSTRGESASILLDHAVIRSDSSVDDFSNKKLTEEKLFE